MLSSVLTSATSLSIHVNTLELLASGSGVDRLEPILRGPGHTDEKIAGLEDLEVAWSPQIATSTTVEKVCG